MNPQNPWATKIPRTAAEWIDHDLRQAQRNYEWSSDHLEELVNGDRAAHNRNIQLQISQWTTIYLWELLRRHAPVTADLAAADIAEACEAGDTFGEWLWDWQQQHAAGQSLILPIDEQL